MLPTGEESTRNRGMNEIATTEVVGHGSASASLSNSELRTIVEQALASVPSGARVLAIVPDRTRDDNTHILFPMASQILSSRKVAQFDALIAQGTHPPMNESQKRAKIGYGPTETPNLGRIFDHEWDKPESLVTLGELSASRITELTGGLINESVP